MPYRRKTVDKHYYHAALIIITALLIVLGIVLFENREKPEFYNPLSDAMIIKVETPVEVPVEKTIGCESEKCEIMAYLVEKFGDEAANAITIIRTCENSTFDQSRQNQNNNGSTDWGTMQINDVNADLCSDLDFRGSWKDNIDCGRRIYDQAGGSWSPWSCSYVVGTKSFWQS
jgi:hypothetical protein